MADRVWFYFSQTLEMFSSSHFSTETLSRTSSGDNDELWSPAVYDADNDDEFGRNPGKWTLQRCSRCTRSTRCTNRCPNKFLNKLVDTGDKQWSVLCDLCHKIYFSHYSRPYSTVIGSIKRNRILTMIMENKIRSLELVKSSKTLTQLHSSILIYHHSTLDRPTAAYECIRSNDSQTDLQINVCQPDAHYLILFSPNKTTSIKQLNSLTIRFFLIASRRASTAASCIAGDLRTLSTCPNTSILNCSNCSSSFSTTDFYSHDFYSNLCSRFYTNSAFLKRRPPDPPFDARARCDQHSNLDSNRRPIARRSNRITDQIKHSVPTRSAFISNYVIMYNLICCLLIQCINRLFRSLGRLVDRSISTMKRGDLRLSDNLKRPKLMFCLPDMYQTNLFTNDHHNQHSTVDWTDLKHNLNHIINQTIQLAQRTICIDKRRIVQQYQQPNLSIEIRPSSPIKSPNQFKQVNRISQTHRLRRSNQLNEFNRLNKFSQANDLNQTKLDDQLNHKSSYNDDVRWNKSGNSRFAYWFSMFIILLSITCSVR